LQFWLSMMIGSVVDEGIPQYDFIKASVLLVIGFLIFRYRDEIGDYTGFWIHGMYVDKPTPGCLFIPVGLILMGAGIVGIIISIKEMMGS